MVVDDICTINLCHFYAWWILFANVAITDSFDGKFYTFAIGKAYKLHLPFKSQKEIVGYGQYCNNDNGQLWQNVGEKYFVFFFIHKIFYCHEC